MPLHQSKKPVIADRPAEYTATFYTSGEIEVPEVDWKDTPGTFSIQTISDVISIDAENRQS